MWWIPLVSVIIGGAITIASNIVLEVTRHKLNYNRQRKVLAGAFAGEISATCEIVSRRRYLEGAKVLLETINDTGAPYRSLIRITQEYFEVYRANVNKLGFLPYDIVEKLPLFYTQAKSLIEDVSPESFSPLDATSAQNMLTEQISILEDMLKLGDELVERLNNEVV